MDEKKTLGQESDQAPVNNSSSPEKGERKFNWWILSTVLFAFLFLLISLAYLAKTGVDQRRLPATTPTPRPTKIPLPTKPLGKPSRFQGTVGTGEQVEMTHCPEGFFLVAEEGAYLVDQTEILLIKVADGPDKTKMLSDPKYIGRKVEVRGKYPIQEFFCEALICECEDYVLAEEINLID